MLIITNSFVVDDFFSVASERCLGTWVADAGRACDSRAATGFTGFAVTAAGFAGLAVSAAGLAVTAVFPVQSAALKLSMIVKASWWAPIRLQATKNASEGSRPRSSSVSS